MKNITKANVYRKKSEYHNDSYDYSVATEQLEKTPGYTENYYEYEFEVNGKIYNGTFKTRFSSIREMYIFAGIFNYHSSNPDILEIEYDVENPSNHKVLILEKIKKKTIQKVILAIFIIIALCIGTWLLFSFI